jgi:DNA polymerase-1
MTVLFVDTYSLLFRAHHALPPMSTARGEPTSALYGLSALCLKLWREHRPEGVAFALDTPAPTFRHAVHDAYKAGRPPLPEPLRSQLARLPEFLRATGAPVFSAPGYEADDVLATLAREAREAGTEGLVVSGDRDLLQVARGTIRVLFVGRRGEEAVLYDEAAVARRFGVPAERLPSYTALAGDPADNLEGVPGVGPTTAARLIGRHGDIAGILSALPEIRPERVRQAIEARRETLLRDERLARLCDDLPLEGPRHAPLGAEARQRLRGFFEALEFKSLLPRLDAIR